LVVALLRADQIVVGRTGARVVWIVRYSASVSFSARHRGSRDELAGPVHAALPKRLQINLDMPKVLGVDRVPATRPATWTSAIYMNQHLTRASFVCHNNTSGASHQ
jgi:hypothetical protein